MNDFYEAEESFHGVKGVIETQVGRVNKYAATAYLAKTKLYQAYEQDASHNVTNINAGKLNEVINLCDVIINSGAYALHDDFGKNFVPEYESGVESAKTKKAQEMGITIYNNITIVIFFGIF